MTKPHAVGYLEVTLAMSVLLPDGTMQHGEMADVTIAFGIPSKPPPRPLTEAETRETIRTNLGRLAAVVEAVFLANGAVHLGQVEDRMTNHGHEVARALSDPVTVHVDFVDEARS